MIAAMPGAGWLRTGRRELWGKEPATRVLSGRGRLYKREKKGSGFVFNENEEFNDVTGVGWREATGYAPDIIEFLWARNIQFIHGIAQCAIP
jgi:hypothetical protein